jgi:hypothetical protein
MGRACGRHWKEANAYRFMVGKPKRKGATLKFMAKMGG